MYDIHHASQLFKGLFAGNFGWTLGMHCCVLVDTVLLTSIFHPEYDQCYYD